MTMQVKSKSTWYMTGNPFVDIGQEMMAALIGVEHPHDLTADDARALLPELVELYFHPDWIKSSYTIFPNSVLNNGKNRQEKYVRLLNGWLEAIEQPDRHSVGAVCAISGNPAQTYLGKVYLPMSDFEGGNFQSANQQGTPLSASVALALQFFPLALLKVGKMLALPQFSNPKVQSKWAEQSLAYIKRCQTINKGGVQDTGTFRAANAFFKLIQDLVQDYQDLPKSSVTLYLFNNFNQVDYKAASELYYMPSKVFGFIQVAMTPDVEWAWRRIVRRGYYTRKETDDEEELQKHSNLVYNKLLANESISSFFLDRKRRCPAVRGHEGWLLFSTYLKEVHNMEQRRLDSLRDLGDRMAALICSHKTKQRILMLERAQRKGQFAEALRRFVRDSIETRQDRMLITFDQLITDVLPHDSIAYDDWREVKSLLLFRIYEQLFDYLKDNLSPDEDTDLPDQIEENDE